MKSKLFLIAFSLLAVLAPVRASAQSPVLIQARSGSPESDRFRADSSGAFIAYGFVRDVGGTTGCAAQIPATGAGTRFMWHPCRGSLRFGRVPTGQTNWDDASMNDFTFAGGNQVVASGYGAFAYGDQVTVSSTVGVGFGSGINVSGTAGFSAGASNVCSGFACTAIGYTVRAGGQGSVALGYRVTANNDYSVALGYRASNNGHTGTFVWGDAATTDSVRNQANNEFRIRAAGGIRLRTSAASNANAGVSSNTGCDLAAGSGSWACSSSRTVKMDFAEVDGEEILGRIARIPVMTWRYRLEADGALHMGAMAEDFHEAFGLGTDDRSIGLTDHDGVNLAAIQALELRTRELNRALERVDRLESELETLRLQQATLMERLARMEAIRQEPR